MQSKYLKNQKIMGCQLKHTASLNWKGLLRSFQTVLQGCHWKIGNGTKASLWFDTWLEYDPLCLLVDAIHPLEITWSLADIISNGMWDLN